MTMRLVCLLIISVFMFACGRDTSKEQTPTSGTSVIVADESFAPILEDQLMVFRSSYPNADLKLMYKPENQLLDLFLNRKVKVAIMARRLFPDEEKIFKSKDIKIRLNRIAVDGLALISNKGASDSTINLSEVLDIMRGKGTKQLVFDNANSSTVRYLMSLAGIKLFPRKGVYALKSNLEVIKYVHNNSGSIGVIGVNWIKDPSEEVEKMMNNIRVLGVKSLAGMQGSDGFYKPSQDNLALGNYPLSRELFIINCEGAPGLGTGFAAFMASERGQRIVLKSGLLPDSIPSREIYIRNN